MNKYYDDKIEYSCEYYKNRVKEIIKDIRDDKDLPVSFVRNLSCAKNCEGSDYERIPFYIIRNKLFDLAGPEIMTNNFMASGHTTKDLKDIIKDNSSDFLKELNQED